MEVSHKTHRPNIKLGKRELVFFNRQGAQLVCRTSSRRYMDLSRAMVTREIVIPAPGTYAALTNRQITQCTLLQIELALPTTGSWLPSRLEFHLTMSRAHRAHFFQLDIRTQKTFTKACDWSVCLQVQEIPVIPVFAIMLRSITIPWAFLFQTSSF